jgi:hypothetical protein
VPKNGIEGKYLANGQFIFDVLWSRVAAMKWREIRMPTLQYRSLRGLLLSNAVLLLAAPAVAGDPSRRVQATADRWRAPPFETRSSRSVRQNAEPPLRWNEGSGVATTR